MFAAILAVVLLLSAAYLLSQFWNGDLLGDD